MSSASNPGSAAGQLMPTWVGVVLALLLAGLMWMVLSSEPEQPNLPDPTEVNPGEDVEAPKDADLAIVDPSPTPTWIDGPLIAELRFLGGFEQEKIRPQRAGSLQGQVLDHNREGISGVRMQIFGGPQDGWSTISKKDGRYFFPELLPGTHYFELDIPGFGRAVRSQRVQRNGTTNRDFLVAPQMGVELEISDFENKPLQGAKLIADINGTEAVTDEMGIGRLFGIVGGDRVLVTVKAENHVPIRVELNMRTQPSNAAPIKVPALPKGGIIQGTVRSWPGNPLPQISVVPRSNRIGTHRIAWETWQGVEVGVDGRFKLENMPTSHLLDFRVFHPKGVSEPAQRAVRPNSSSPTTLSFVIKRGQGRVQGQVLDADGNPIPKAKLVLESADPAAMLAHFYPGLAEAPSTTMLPVPAAMRRELKADTRGRFDLAVGDHPQGTGSLVLTASAPGFQPRRVSITRMHENLKVRLSPEDRGGVVKLELDPSITAGTAGLKIPAVNWYLDGKMAEDQEGFSVEGTQLLGLPVGQYELIVRAGEQVVLHRSELKVRGLERLQLK
jgi:hypothetical protein